MSSNSSSVGDGYKGPWVAAMDAWVGATEGRWLCAPPGLGTSTAFKQHLAVVSDKPESGFWLNVPHFCFGVHGEVTDQAGSPALRLLSPGQGSGIPCTWRGAAQPLPVCLSSVPSDFSSNCPETISGLPPLGTSTLSFKIVWELQI